MRQRSCRLKERFKKLAGEERAGLITFITAGDPNIDISNAILNGLPDAGADIIELGMPFTDPMADGPVIQESSLRALKAGQDMHGTLSMVKTFREKDQNTPIVLMGYFNPIYSYGVERFSTDAAKAGVDGLIIVDLPPEEDSELRLPANAKEIDFIRLATPTSDKDRLPRLMQEATGFVYYVSIAGITGTKSSAISNIAEAITLIKNETDLPLAIGFGIKTADHAAEVARLADAVVVGSAIVERIGKIAGTNREIINCPDLLSSVLDFVSELSKSVRRARS
jgi:tryptophan synthase alpha chain